jgi:hypothetical protein
MFWPMSGVRVYRHLRLRLTRSDHEKLDGVLSGGIEAVRTVLRALALRHLHHGKTASEVAANVRLTPKAVRDRAPLRGLPASNRRSTISSGPEPPLWWRTANGSASSTWSAPTRPRGAPAGPCSGGGGSYEAAPGSASGKGNHPDSPPPPRPQAVAGKKCGEQPYDPKRPVVCLDEKPVTLHADVRHASPAGLGREASLVNFALVVERGDSYAQNIHVRHYESMEHELLRARRLQHLEGFNTTSTESSTLARGQPVSDFALTDQTGVTLSQFGKVVAVTFIYTSCPLPNYCFQGGSDEDLCAVFRFDCC